MSVFTIFQIAQQGMTVQRERLEAAAANLANANSTRTEDGGLYRRRDIVFKAIEIEESWKSVFDRRDITGGDLPAIGVESEIQPAGENEHRMVYKPGHADANEDGYIKLPDVEPLEETVNMMSATRAFEANATAFNTAKEIARVSLGLGDA